MTNQQIITNALIEANLFTEDQIETMVSQYGCVPVKSYAEWQRLGYQVKKGEKSILKCLLWNPKKSKEHDKNTNEDIETFDGSFYQRLTSLFLITQCERG